MTLHSQTEIERKYAVDETTLLPDLAGLPGVDETTGPETTELEAVYFDTDREDLARHRIVLRRRTGGTDAGWHVKLPAAVGRTEIHAPLTDDDPSANSVIPEGVLDRVRSRVRDRELTPLARVQTTRTTWQLSDEKGEPLIEVADDRVSTTDLRGGILRTWREWEVELLGDEDATRRDLLEAIERRLLAAGAHPSPSQSKLAQALGRDSLAPETGIEARTETGGATDVRPGIRPKSPASEAALAIVRPLVEALEAADPAVRGDEPEGVHEMRKIVRRLRSALVGFRAVFAPAAVTDLNGRLRRLGVVLGEARDLEVRAQHAEEAIAALPWELQADDARDRLVEGTNAEARQARLRLLGYLSDGPYYRLLDDLDEFAAAPPLGDGADVPAKEATTLALHKAVRRTLKRSKAIKGDGDDTDRLMIDLHSVRKAARRARYLAEAVERDLPEVLGVSCQPIADAAERIHDLLGDHRDDMLFADHLLFESNRAHAAKEKTLVYGTLYERSRSDAARMLPLIAPAVRELKRSAKKL